MDLVEVGRIIRARWYVLVPLLLLTVALAIGVDKSVPTKYQANSSISLLASESATAGTTLLPGTGNPFLNYNSSLNDTADFLVRRMGSTDAANDLAKLGVTESYAVALAAGAQGPFITLAVTGTNPTHVLASMDALTKYTQQELQVVQEQASVKPVDMIRSMVIVPPGPPSKQTKTKTQDVLGAGIGGLVITFLSVFVVENIAASRKRRRRRVPFGADAQLDGDGGREFDRGFDGDEESGSHGGSEAPTEVISTGSWFPDYRGRVGSADGVGVGAEVDGAGVDDGLEREPFEPARPELSGRAPGSRD